MLFDTPEGRSSYYQDLRDGHAVPNPGDALSHARGTNLGVWGDVGMLEADCLRVLSYEMIEVGSSRGGMFVQRPSVDELADLARHTSTWRVAFAHARHGQDQRIEHVVANLSGRDVPRMPEPDGAPLADCDVAESIMWEVTSGRGVAPLGTTRSRRG